MREIIVQKWCDRHADLGDNVPAETTPAISVRGVTREPLTLELCAACDEELLQPLVALLRDRGVPLDLTAPKAHHGRPANVESAREVCPICKQSFVTTYVPNHLRQKHGATNIQPETCPDCGEGRDTQQGMVLHRVRAHQYDVRADLLASLSPKKEPARPTRRRRAS